MTAHTVETVGLGIALGTGTITGLTVYGAVLVAAVRDGINSYRNRDWVCVGLDFLVVGVMVGTGIALVGYAARFA